MKKVKLVILALFAVAGSFGQKVVKIEEAKEFAGDSVTICTKIFGAVVNDNGMGDGTYLFAGGNYPDAPLTILIRSENRRYFDYKPDKDLKDREVCVTGRLEMIKDKLTMIISKQAQIDIK